MTETKAPTQDEIDIQQIAEAAVKSGMFPDIKLSAQAIMRILAGRELGFPVIASLTGVYVVKGRVSLGANLIAAVIKRSGRYDYRIKRLDNEACELEFVEDTRIIGTSTFTLDDAKRAGLVKAESNWVHYPRNMMFARALSNGAKWFTPDIFGGPVYTPDELRSERDEDVPLLPEASVPIDAQIILPAEKELAELAASAPGAVATLVENPENGKPKAKFEGDLAKALRGPWQELAALCPRYAKVDRTPDAEKILVEAWAAGFQLVTGGNWPDVRQALITRAQAAIA